MAFEVKSLVGGQLLITGTDSAGNSGELIVDYDTEAGRELRSILKGAEPPAADDVVGQAIWDVFGELVEAIAAERSSALLNSDPELAVQVAATNDDPDLRWVKGGTELVLLK